MKIYDDLWCFLIVMIYDDLSSSPTWLGDLEYV